MTAVQCKKQKKVKGITSQFSSHSSAAPHLAGHSRGKEMLQQDSLLVTK